MNYVSNESNIQAYRQQMSYKTTVTAINRSSQINKNDADENDAVSNNAMNFPIIYNSEKDLPMIDKAKKMLMESILGQFTKEGDAMSLFPNDAIQLNQKNQVQENPYREQFSQDPTGFMFESSYEYYEKTTIEFNAQATIKTPQGEYQIEINFSYTEEFYEKNQTQIAYAQSSFDTPFEINLEEDDDSLKNLKRLDLMFDVIKEDNEEEKSLLEQIKELLQKRKQTLLEKLDSSDDKGVGSSIANELALDNFRVFERNENEENSLLAIQKDGIGVYLANSHNSSSYVSASIGQNGVSIQSGYSESSTSISISTTDIKV